MITPRARFLLAILLGLATTQTVHAQAPTAEEIIERLKSSQANGQRPATRGLSAPAASAGSSPGAGVPSASTGQTTPPPDGDDPANRFFGGPQRGLSAGERKEIAAIAQTRPAIDLTIYFDFNSAEVGPKAVPALVELGRAVSSDSLAGVRFLLAGHTDAKGGAAYNLKLSQRRAEAIKRYLVTHFKVDERRLLAIGYGKEQPKNASNPLADENRRVQVVNFGG